MIAISRTALNRYTTPVVILPRLTYRKLSVLLHLSAGADYRAIADALGIHWKTVRAHVVAIAARLPEEPALPPRDKALLYCDRLLVAHADDLPGVLAPVPTCVKPSNGE